MAFAPWNIFRRGKLRTDQEEQERESQGKRGRTGFSDSTWKRNDLEKQMSAVLEKIAGEVGTSDIRAGMCLSRSCSTCSQIMYSCSCISSAKDALYLPHPRRI